VVLLRIFSYLCGLTKSPFQWVKQGHSVRIKRLDYESKHHLHLGSRLRMHWDFYLLCPVCLHGIHRDIFTFTVPLSALIRPATSRNPQLSFPGTANFSNRLTFICKWSKYMPFFVIVAVSVPPSSFSMN
jgi:hypothetical protein